MNPFSDANHPSIQQQRAMRMTTAEIQRKRNMRTDELNKVIALDLPRGDEKVIAAGPVTLQPHSRPYRIVLLNWGDQFSVHTEYFEVNTDEVRSDNNTTDLAEACKAASTFIENGQYFKPTEFDKAVRIFADKLEHHAQFVQSIYREVA